VFQGSADEYRAWAKQCLVMAARGGREEDKRAWLQLADKWQRPADQTSNRNPAAQQAQQSQPEQKP